VPQRNNYTPQKPKASSKEKPKSLFFSAAGSFVSNACAAVKDIGEDFEEFGKDVLREVEDAEPKVQKIIKDIPNKIEKMGNKISNITIDDVSDIVKKKFFGP
jgi:tRNA U54 and U55 pseudouridine synthase Pus10